MCKIFKIILIIKVTHGVCAELSTENVDKATGVEKLLHHDDKTMREKKSR